MPDQEKNQTWSRITALAEGLIKLPSNWQSSDSSPTFLCTSDEVLVK
jgi:hypothetical protein